MNVIKYELLKDKLIKLQDEYLLLDKDVAQLYDIKPSRLKEQIKRNIEKFPSDYARQISEKEIDIMVSQNAIPSKQYFGGYNPWVFTEKGLYMVATILKSTKATEATFTIIETFAKIKELSRNINALENAKTPEEQKAIAQNVGAIFEEIIDIEPVVEKRGDETIEVENRIELNIGFVKVSRTVKSKKCKNDNSG